VRFSTRLAGPARACAQECLYWYSLWALGVGSARGGCGAGAGRVFGGRGVRGGRMARGACEACVQVTASAEQGRPPPTPFPSPPCSNMPRVPLAARRTRCDPAAPCGRARRATVLGSPRRATRAAAQWRVLRHDCPPLRGLWARLSGTSMGRTGEPGTSTPPSTGLHLCYGPYPATDRRHRDLQGPSRERAVAERHGPPAKDPLGPGL
jgi:hypothetical protein